MRASDKAYVTLREEIQAGSLAPGTVLAEVEQSERLGVSRTPFREALGRLISDGLVAQQSPRVTVVTGIEQADIRGLFQVRRALEETAARLAATSGHSDSFTFLAEEFQRVDLRDDAAKDEYYRLIDRFDQTLDAAVDNVYLTTALQKVRTHLVRVRRMAKDNPERLSNSAKEHQLIASAIGLRDADLAAHATHVHLHNALTTILSSLDDTHSLTEGQP